MIYTEEHKKKKYCEICGGYYTYWNKNKHEQTKRHKQVQLQIEKTKIKYDKFLLKED